MSGICSCAVLFGGIQHFFIRTLACFRECLSPIVSGPDWESCKAIIRLLVQCWPRDSLSGAAWLSRERCIVEMNQLVFFDILGDC